MSGAALEYETPSRFELPRPLRVLIVEDVEDDAELVVMSLRAGGIEPESERVFTADALRAALRRGPWHVILADYAMPGFSGPDAFRIVRELGLDVPFILVSGSIGEEAAVAAMKMGVSDYLLKDNLARIVPVIAREVCEAQVRARLTRSQEILERSERLRALGQMAAGISHDLKNVLVNPLGLQLQIAERALAKGNIDRAVEVMGTMRAILRQGLDAIERLRQFSRQTPERKLQEVRLDEAVREAVDMARARIRPGCAPLAIVESLGAPAAIPANPAEVVAALVNLLVNAIDAMADGGTIALRSGTDEEGAWVEVADDGPGMSDEVKQRAFEPFFTTKGEEGTGIGLAMVFACVHRHGGHVTLDTAPGQGARFRLWFPRQTPPGAPVLDT